jgi:outer membrane protein TolC
MAPPLAAQASPLPAMSQSDGQGAPQPPQSRVFGIETSAEQLTFDVAVRRALARNPTALQAREEVRRFHALMEEVRSISLPTLSGIGSYTRLDADRVSGGQVAVPKGALNLNVTLNAPLLYPRGWVRWGQAGDQVDVALANEADVRRTIAVSTARAYLTIITEKRLLETARIARDNAKAHYEFTHAQRVGGVGNRLDEARAAQELTTDEVNLQNQNVALLRAREGLGVLVASDGSVDTADEGVPTRMPSFNEAMTDADKLRTDVLTRRRVAKAADRTVRDVWAEYSPYLNLIAFPFYETPPTPTVPRTGWQAELVLTVPFYDGGLRYGEAHEYAANAEEARLNVEAALRQAKSEVRVAFEEMQRDDLALDQANQSSAFARRALELANLAYRAGATSNLEVIDAERQARDAETQAAIAEDASREARLDLLAASGRFP